MIKTGIVTDVIFRATGRRNILTTSPSHFIRSLTQMQQGEWDMEV